MRKSERTKKIKAIKSENSIHLLSRSDKITAVAFIVMFFISLVAYWFVWHNSDFTMYTALPIMAMPFFVIGIVYYFVSRRFFAALAIVVISSLAYLVSPTSVLFIVYLLVCTEGVAQIVEIIQRFTFYRVLDTIEHVNVKKKMSLFDRGVVFIFNIPVDLDTRNLDIDRNIVRNKLPWKDMFGSILLALLFCIFLWIYMFLNPSFEMGVEGVPIYTFTIVLYLAAGVLPWTIFSSLNVRIGTEYRDFKIYSGFLETFKKMFLPAFAALIFLIGAVSASPENFFYVGVSLVMIIVMILFTSVMYYTINEMAVVNDILDNWDKFHPSTLYSDYSEEKKSSFDDGVPGTPRRNPADCFITDVKGRSH